MLPPRRSSVGLVALCALTLAACVDSGPTGPAPAPQAPRPSATLVDPGAPVCYTETFEEFTRGQYITEITPGPLTLAISTTAFRNTASNVAGQAQIFDTDHISLTSNDGTDMEWQGTRARCDGCEGLGNLLIVHRLGSSAVLDNNPGGRHTLTGFPAGQWWVESFTVVDNDLTEPTVKLFVDGALVAQSTPLGDGSVQTVTPGADVLINSSVAFSLGTSAQDTKLGSGGIDNITFCTNPPPPPDAGCTRTPGYWKNHAGFGPQDNVLGQYLPITLGNYVVDDELDAVNILSRTGGSWNGIVKLRAHLLAAKLNIAAGASDGDIDDVIAAADAFLTTHSEGDWSSLSAAEQTTVLGWKDDLDDYNNGVIGPGHCD